jgi:TPR repeat protein
MTRDELDEILHQCYSVEIFPEDAAELIWGRPFDGETEKINTAKSDSRTSEIAQTSPIEKTGTVLAYAQAANARRQYEMGLMCYHGEGMPEDKEQAVEWWQRAAAQGNYEAQLSLANAYRTGTGVEKHDALANYWLEQAGSQETPTQPQ